MFVHELVSQGKPDAIAVIDHERRITYKELSELVHNCRNKLYAAGVRQGDRVAIFSRNSADYICAYFGIAALGAIAVPINFQLSSREIAYILKDSGAKHVLTYQPLDLVDAMAQLRCDMPVIQHDIRLAGKQDDFVPEAPALPAEFDEDSPVCIIYTSGTTGNPKGAVLSHRNLIINVRQQIAVIGCSSEDHILCVLPMYHAFGWTLSVLYPLYCGAETVILDSFTPKETITVIREEKINHLYIVPSICSLLTKLAKPEDMASVRIVISGGAPLPMQIEKEFQAKFGIDISEGYGLSEASPLVTLTKPGHPVSGSIGTGLPYLEYKIVDPNGDPVPVGEPGELIIKGGNVMLGYWNLPDVTSDVMRGGWLHTADVMKVDENGYYFIIDRIKDMIISMGENIYPREVEELIYQFPGIDEVAVIGIEDKIRGQAGACFYSVREGQTVEVRLLKKFLQKNLALYKIPREFHVLDKLPRTSTGKIAKRLILKQFMEEKEAKAAKKATK